VWALPIEAHGYEAIEMMRYAVFVLALFAASHAARAQNLVVDVVKDFGAVADGVADDTAAIQAAVDHVHKAGGGTINFPPGTYLVTSVNIRAGITYQGHDAVITRPANQGKWCRSFTTHPPYAGEEDSPLLTVRGLIFDGNMANQGPHRQWELEQAHMLFLNGNPKYPGRLRALVENCEFRNGVADGVSIYTNVEVDVRHCRATDVFRGGFVFTGGNSIARVTDFITQGDIHPTGIDIEIDGRGYGDTLRVEAHLQDLHLINGDFDIAVSDGSTVVCENVRSDDGPFYLYAKESQVRYKDCVISVGAADTYMNRIVFPGDVTFEHCELKVTRRETGRPYTFFAAADVWWQIDSLATDLANQSVVFRDCRFTVDPSIQPQDTVYAIHSHLDSQGEGNTITITGGRIAEGFDAPIVVFPGGVKPTLTDVQGAD
jgi:hypothetical protein